MNQLNLSCIIGGILLAPGSVRVANASPSWLLCVNDSSSLDCQGTNNDWIMLLHDGVNPVSEFNGSGASGVTDSGFNIAGVEDLSLSGGSFGVWNVGGNIGETFSSSNTIMALTIHGVSSAAGTLNIIFAAGNFPGSDTSAGPLQLTAGGTDSFSTVNLTACAETPAGDPENFKSCSGVVALNGGGASTSVVTSLGSSTNFGTFSSNSFISGSSFGIVQVVTITASQSDTITGTFNISEQSVPEPASFAMATIAMAALIVTKRLLAKAVR